MRAISDIARVVAPAAAVGALAVLGDHALESEQARMPERIGSDLALLEVGGPKARATLALRIDCGSLRRSVAHQDVEGVELDLGIVLPAVQAVESGRGRGAA